MKHLHHRDNEHDAPRVAPEAMPRVDHEVPVYPPVVPTRLWKGIAVGLSITAVVAFGVFAVWLR
ncbi:MAG: hypothetical protein ABI887_09605 [Burkholderiales bacterium]